MYASHLAWNNLSFSRELADKLLVGMNETNENNCQPTLDILQPFIFLEDKYTRLRLEWLLGVPELHVKYQKSP